MVIVVHDGVVRLDDPDDCKGFKVVVEESTESEVANALAEVGRMADHDTAWIRTDVVRRLARGRVDAAWDGEFETMLDYAATKSWLSDARDEIQAHVEWPA